MATRAEMVEKAAEEVTGTKLPFAGMTYCIDYDEATKIGQSVLDAVLPQVSTVEELKALPLGSVLLDREGEPWKKLISSVTWMAVGSNHTYGQAEVLDAQPLTVVWTP